MLWHELLFPFRCLYRGHVLLLAYMATLILGALWLTNYLGRNLFSFLLELESHGSGSSPLLKIIWFGGVAGISLLAIPVILTGAALPLRYLWITGSLYSLELLTKTPVTMRESLRAMGIALRLSLRTVIPLAALVLLYFPFVQRLEQRAIFLLYILILIGAIFATTRKALPLLLSPLLAICGQVDGRIAVGNAERLLRPKMLELMTILVGLAGALLALYVTYHGHTLSPRRFTRVEIGIACACTWYAFTLICATTMHAISRA